MKRMTLNDEEVALVLNHRQEVLALAYEAELAEKRANCDHEWEFDFINYKCVYYKCPKCGLGKVT